MIRKLRLKIVGISVVTVAAVLICALVVLTLSTRSQMSQGSEARLYAALEGKLDRSELPGSSGLPCFVADTVDPGAAFAKNTRFLPLSDTDAWVRAIRGSSLKRNPDARKNAADAGYDIRTSAGILQEFYLRKAAEVGL